MYKTVREFASDEYTVKRSRFIGCICPVSTQEHAAHFISEQKAAHRDARHTAFAYIIRQNGVQRCSDDGEPQGTAGIPCLEVLKREGLTDVVVTVTRYFGGILLGGGGLVRAYSHTASLAVAASEIVVMRLYATFDISVDYSMYNIIMKLVSKHGATAGDAVFGTDVSLRVTILDDKSEACKRELIEACSGNLTISQGPVIFL